ncbi:hypothetical protein GcM3_020036, partial [Golovinomyces cichoracearum]
SCLSDKIGKEVVQSLPAEIVYDSLDGRSLEHFSVVVGKDRRRSAKDILEEAHAEVAEVEASRKRRHVEFDKFSTEVPEDNHQFNSNGPRINPKIKRGSLSPINRRRGEGPLDYKSILANTMITMSVLEFCQASSDAAKHFRHLVT